jgi:hypothetical protein
MWCSIKGSNNIIKARVFRRDSPMTRSRRSAGSGGESCSVLTSVERNAVKGRMILKLRRLLALKANEWLITTPPQLSLMDLANHCAAFPGLSLLNTRAVLVVPQTNLDLRNTTLGYGFHFQHRNPITLSIERFAHDSGRTLARVEYGCPKGSPNSKIYRRNPTLQLSIQCSPQRTPKRLSSEHHRATRQQVIV